MKKLSILFTIICILIFMLNSLMISCTGDDDDDASPTPTPTQCISPTPTPIDVTGTHYVAPTGDDTLGDGSSAHPWLTISHAINELQSENNWALVAREGIYSFSQGESFPLVIPAGCSLLGQGPHYTIIDAEQQARVIKSTQATLLGLTVQNGLMTGSGLHACGGGIWADGGVIDRVTVTGNKAYSGGGIFAQGNCTILSSTVLNNLADECGGGIDLRFGLIRDCLIYGNDARGLLPGGGVNLEGISEQQPAIMINTLVSGNEAARGGGVGQYYGYGQIINCSISQNICNNWGGGICSEYGTLWMINSIVQYNQASSHSPNIYYDRAWIGWSCSSDLEPGVNGNITDNPAFVDNYFLSQTDSGQSVQSPCVNAGAPDFDVPGLSDLTTRTNLQPDDGILDMGYHHHIH
ncbi:DUF1565 domain-containing protein [bacterium]|nr:DUF1565 domain-containing protein [bacterium]